MTKTPSGDWQQQEQEWILFDSLYHVSILPARQSAQYPFGMPAFGSCRQAVLPRPV